VRGAAWAAAVALLAACVGPEREAATVVTTIVPVAMLVRELGGEHVRAGALVPPGASPHTFEPRPRDLAELANAQLFLQVGAGLDDWATRLASTGGPALRRVVLIEAPGLDPLPADPSHLHDHGAGHGADAQGTSAERPHGAEGPWDPHVWLDPIRVRDALAPALADALAAVDPAGAEETRARLADFQARLTSLDEEIRGTLADVPRRGFVPFHNAWRYFAKRYDLVEVAVVQEFPGEEPTPRELGRLVAAARGAGVPAILVEPQLDRRMAAVIAAEFQGTTVLVDPTGDPSDPERATYEGLLRFNARAFRRALGGGAQ
jgi:zinc transport system substrate-binding protein